MARNEKLPAIQFYPGDWRKDVGVQSLSFHDRGVWFEMILLMHESERRGALVLSGKPMSDEAIARVLGLGLPAFKKTVNTLLETGVASRSEDGAIMSRRMVKDEAKRQSDTIAGKRGGNPALRGEYNEPGYVYAIRRASDGFIKIGISVNPHKRLYKLRYEAKGDTLSLMGTLHVEDMGTCEACIHRYFASCPGSGEWFKLNDSQTEELISTLKGQSNGIFNGKQTPSSSVSVSVSSSEPPSPPLDHDGIATAVMFEIGASGMDLRMALAAIALNELGNGRTAEQVKDFLIGRWRLYLASAPRLEWTYGSAAKFFGGAMWALEDVWPWKKGQRPEEKTKPMLAVDKLK